MKPFTYFADLPPEAGMALLFAGVIAFIIGLKQKPKTTLTVLLLIVGTWAYIEHGHVLHEQFNNLSQARMK